MISLLLLAIGLSMDAFAVSVCKGLSVEKVKPKHYLCIGLWFGGFQALMPTLGFFLGSTFADAIEAVDHWVAFGLLVLIGANMIKEALSKEEEKADASFGVRTMFILAVSTSIDALVVGISLAMTPAALGIYASAGVIGVTTFALSALGLKVGSVFGAKYKNRAELVGGIILILLGVKVLLEGLIPGFELLPL